MSETITRKQIAEKLGVSASCLKCICKWGDDGAMPKRLTDEKLIKSGAITFLYDKKEVMAWLATNPLERYQEKKQATPETKKLIGLDLLSAKKFLTGQFDPRRQQQTAMAKRIAARQVPPVRRVMTVNAELWRDDRDDSAY